MNESAATTRNPSAWNAARYLCVASFAFLFSAQFAVSQATRPKNPKVRTHLASPLKKATQTSATITPHQAESIAPPSPAEIVFRNGLLIISANNSDLEQILSGVAQVSGMRISGAVGNTRVFGVYGPQDPDDVLTELLSGAGFNIMMVGRTQKGTPRELLLTPKRGAASPPAVGQVIVTNTAPGRDVTDSSSPRPPASLGPGALPSGPPPPSVDPEERRQQSLRRLQQMHDHQKTQNPPQ
jgi:hypothetical protein